MAKRSKVRDDRKKLSEEEICRMFARACRELAPQYEGDEYFFNLNLDENSFILSAYQQEDETSPRGRAVYSLDVKLLGDDGHFRRYMGEVKGPRAKSRYEACRRKYDALRQIEDANAQAEQRRKDATLLKCLREYASDPQPMSRWRPYRHK